MEFVRRGLAGEITARYAELADGEVLQLVPVAPELELAASAVVDPGAAEQIRDAAWAASGGLDLNPPVLVTSRGGRAALQRVLCPEMPNTWIMDQSEVDRRVAVTIVDEQADARTPASASGGRS